MMLRKLAPLRFEGGDLAKLHQHEEDDEHRFRVRERASLLGPSFTAVLFKQLK